MKGKGVYECNGKTGTIKELASAAGINHKTVRSRMERGKSLEEALTEKVHKSGRRNHASRRYIVEGQEYRTLSEISNDYGISICTIGYRMKKKGMTLEEAVNAPLYRRATTKLYTINGVTDSVPNLCRRFGFSYSSVNSRLSDGLPPKVAFR